LKENYLLPGNNTSINKIDIDGYLDATSLNLADSSSNINGSFTITKTDSSNSTTTSSILMQKQQIDDSDDAKLTLEYTNENSNKLQAYTNTSSIYDSLLNFLDITENNLLYVYVKDYLPIISSLVNAKDNSSSNEDFKINLNNIDGIFEFYSDSPYIFDFKYTKDDSSYHFQIDLNPSNTDYSFSIIIKDFEYSECVGDISLSVLKTAKEDKVTLETDTDKYGYVDLSSLPILIKMGITTTERKEYEMSGNLNLSTSGVASWFVNVDCHPTVYVALRVGNYDDKSSLFTVDGYVKIINTEPKEKETSPTVPTTSRTTNTYPQNIIEYYIKNTNIYFKKEEQVKTVKETREWNWKKFSYTDWSTSSQTLTHTYTYMKTTQEGMINNIIYYLVEFTLDQQDLKEKILDNETIKNLFNNTDADFLEYFKYFKKIDNNNYFQCYLNLGSVLPVYLDLYYDSSSYYLNRVHAYTTFDITIAKVTFDLDVTNNETISSEFITSMQNYDDFFTNWESDSNLSKLQYRTDIENQTDSNYIYQTSTTENL